MSDCKFVENLFRVEYPANICVLTNCICVHTSKNKYHEESGNCLKCQIPVMMKDRAIIYIEKRLEKSKEGLFKVGYYSEVEK